MNIQIEVSSKEAADKVAGLVWDIAHTDGVTKCESDFILSGGVVSSPVAYPKPLKDAVEKQNKSV